MRVLTVEWEVAKAIFYFAPGFPIFFVNAKTKNHQKSINFHENRHKLVLH